MLLIPIYRAMVLCATMTSMNIAEICGLRWKRVNLTAGPVIVDGESIPPFHLAVREQWYLRNWGSVKRRARRRNLPMASLLYEALRDLKAVSRYTGPDDPVFASDLGRPVDEKNILRRHLRKTAVAIGVPRLGWHDLRRTFATLADQLGFTIGERKALMGHSQAAMTLRYTETPTEHARLALEELAGKVKGTVN
jgi:integrase